jgi:biopolymer transport protein ExbD
MPWQIRHEGSPRIVQGLSLQQIIDGLRDGLWEPTDEVQGPGETGWRAIENHPQLAEAASELEPASPRFHGEETRLDMNALIDVCLVLLIFFILTTTYAAAVQKVVPMSPVKSDGRKIRTVSVDDIKKRMIRVQAHLDKNGKPVIRVENQTVMALADDGQSIDVDRLRDAIRPFVKGEDGKSKIILDAREISWGDVIAIQDGAKAAGVREIHHLMRK